MTLIFIVLSLSVLAQANPGTKPPNRDYGFYIYIGKQITRGNIPYQDVWESKPPAIFYLNAVAVWIGRGSRWGVWIVEFLFLFTSMFTSFILLKKLWGFLPALFGLCTWVAGLDLVLNGGNFTEEYPILFHFIALLIFLKLLNSPNHWFYSLVLGLLASLSILFRPNNAVVECLILMILTISLLFQKRMRDVSTLIVWGGIGILIPILITSAYFAKLGLFQAFIEASVTYNLAYSGTQMTNTSPLVAGFEHLKVPAMITLCGYVLAIFQIKKYSTHKDLPLILFMLVGLPFMMYMSDPARRNYPHYFINWLPWVALFSGFIFFNLKNINIYSIHEKYNLPLVATALVLVLSLGQFTWSGRAQEYIKSVRHILYGPFIEMRTPVSIYVENHTEPGEPVLFWAAYPGENFMSHRDTPSSTLFYPLMINSETSKRLNDKFLQDIKSNPPVLVVDLGRLEPLSLDPQIRTVQRSQGIGWPYPPDNLEEFFSIIENDYHLETVVKGKHVYRINNTIKP